MSPDFREPIHQPEATRNKLVTSGVSHHVSISPIEPSGGERPMGPPTPPPPRDAGELFRTHRLPMTRLAFLLTGDAGSSDEIVQDAFLEVHRRWHRLDNPIGYLRTSVLNGCRSHQRHRRVVERTPTSLPGTSELGASELGDALSALPYRQRAALALRYFADLPDEDIASALGVRPATVRSLIHRGLAALRKEIGS